MSSQEQSKQSAARLDIAATRELQPARTPPRAAPAPGEESSLVRYVWTVVEGWPVILGVVALTVALGVAYLLVATPIYHADVIVQVEAPTKGLALEQLLSQGTMGPAEKEMAIIRSRSSLGSVVDQLGLDLAVSPRRFPLVGGAYARRYKGAGPAPVPFGPPSFAWGGERLRIRRLDVPDELFEIPLRLTVTGAGSYRLRDPDGRLDLEGQAGKLASVAFGDRRVELFVTELNARPGTQFEVTKRRRSDVVANLQRELRIAEDGKLSGVLVISLDGPDPAKVAGVLDAVANNYLRQNVDRKSAEAAQQLAFLESQLPTVKQNVGEAETALNKFLATHGAVNLSNESQSVLERAAEVEKELTSIEMQRSELRQRFTENHPALASLNEKLSMLRGERNSLNSRMRQMPEAEADAARLQRDLRVSNELYNVLLNKTQELRIVKSGTVGNVVIVDSAVVPHKAAWPKGGTVLALSAILGLLGGIGCAFVRKAFSQGLEDAEDVEASTGLPVYATIPHSDSEDSLVRRRAGSAASVLAVSDPQDPAVENLRSVRTSLQFALVEATNNVVSVSGPSPGVGKSFVCVNLGYVLATSERRVLLVDGDLRRGRLHRFFGLDRKPGLSDVLSDAVQLTAAIHSTPNPAVDVLPTGSIPPNAAELLASHRFRGLVDKLARSYAYVLFDTPPALAVTDATIIGALCGVNLLVLKAGQHTSREIALCVKRFAQSGATLQGAVLNDVRATAGRYGKYGRYQRYDYRSHAE